jgi:imidazoleglycerol-phosphate dehydratase
MQRFAELERKTSETQIRVKMNLDGGGTFEVNTGIGFFDHMLTLMALHGLFDLTIAAEGDIGVDHHHTVEDVGLTIGQALSNALGDRKGIARYGFSVVPMDDAIAEVAVDLSNRPFLVMRVPENLPRQNDFDVSLAREFFRALSQKGGMNLHIHLPYGENWHHMIEAAFKGLGRALRMAVQPDERIQGVLSSKGAL